jgi:hypothetical protein
MSTSTQSRSNPKIKTTIKTPRKKREGILKIYWSIIGLTMGREI